jgi:2-desacetyl-2-hydroxyethyl bacteriochlorophyllide A dehydrogenase
VIRVVTADRLTVEVDGLTGAPEPAEGEVVIAVERVGVCGSDAHVYEGTHPYLGYPQVQGHEVVGRVVQLGAGVTTPAVGERVVLEPTVPCGHCVACRRGSPNACVRLDVIGITLPGGLSEALAVPAVMVHPVDGLDPDVAVFVEPLAIAVHAINRAEVAAGDDVVVIGAGSIGRSIALAALDAGARVLVVERTAQRAEIVRRLGVDVCGTGELEFRAAVLDFAGPDGPGIVIDATGSGELVGTAVDLVAHSGCVVVVGISQDDLVVPIALLTRKEVAILGSRNSERDFPRAIDVARRNADALREMITDRLPLDQAEAAFRSVLERTSFGKVLVVLDD